MDLLRKNNDSYVIGIGASAGGLEALRDFFSNTPTNLNAAFVVIQHLSPDYKSLMDELLARYTSMPIHVAEDGMEVIANNIYLIPPRKNLSLFHGKLYLENKKDENTLNLPIDIFFRSLALDKGKKAIGIILSGTGSDGTLGIKAIKEAGGIIMVQDEKTAKFDGMPRSSISTGIVDYILEASHMGNELYEYLFHPLEKENNLVKSNEMDTLSKITLILRNYSNIDFSYYKESTIIRRIERRVKINRFTNFEDYVELLSDSEKEKEILHRELLIGVTSFFRDTDAFEEIEKLVLPKLSFDKGSIRVWSAGCSTGEEVYSLAILIHEHLLKNQISCEVKIFATDIDRYALDVANKGFYLDSVVSDVKPEYLSKYFIKKEHGYIVNDTIRNMVVFAKHNILKDPPFSKLDMLLCRNLFIYIKPEMQQKVLAMFYYSLQPAGYLILGSSESLGDIASAFDVISHKWKIYKYKAGYTTHISHMYQPTNITTVSLDRISAQHVQVPIKGEKLLTEVLSKVMPPSIILDKEDNIVQLLNNVSAIIQLKPGRFSSNLFHNITKEMSVFVNNILRRLKNNEDYVKFENIPFKNNTFISIEGRSLAIEHVNYYLLSFITINPSVDRASSFTKVDVDQNTEMSEQLQHLERELQISQESLQATVEELESSNEELQSSNEELIASNEELQSTNEELQSVNEELYTVNNEYQSKIDELTNLTNDLDNLIKNTEVGALYLDRKLCIRKITPVVSNITNIIDSDIGRPIAHIAVSSYYPELMNDINQVVDSLQGIEREIKDGNNNVWLTRIRPFRTEYNSVDGIIITFVDITSLYNQKALTKDTNTRLKEMQEIGKLTWLSWNNQTNKFDCDPTLSAMLGYSSEDFVSNINDYRNLIHKDDIDNVLKIIQLSLLNSTDIWSVTYRIKNNDGIYCHYLEQGSVVSKDENNKPLLCMSVLIDITDNKNILGD